MRSHACSPFFRAGAAVLVWLTAIGGAAAQDIEFYERADFGGTRLTLSESAPNLGGYGASARVVSAVVRRGQWELCSLPNYGGACMTLGPGRYAQLPPAMQGNVMSAREVGKAPPPVVTRPGTLPPGTVVLYSDEFAGQELVVSDSVSDLRSRNFNDLAAAVVIADGEWDLCSDGGYSGTCMRFRAGRHVLPPALRGQLSSLRPAGGGRPVTPGQPGSAALVLYEGGNFGGRQLPLSDAAGNLAEQGFNDRASSVEIFRGRWQICAHANFNEPCTVLGPGRHQLQGPLQNSVSSVRPLGGRRDDPRPPSGGAVSLYESFDLGGRSLLVSATVTNLRSEDFNDRARSVDIHSGRWELCSDSDFRGQCVILGPGRHTLPEGLSGRLSSLRPR